MPPVYGFMKHRSLRDESGLYAYFDTLIFSQTLSNYLLPLMSCPRVEYMIPFLSPLNYFHK